jgi:hypothetical protein
MARIRTVKPDLFTSPSMRLVGLEARYLAVGLFTEADDQGRFIASAKLIAGSLFPHDDDVTAAKVERWLAALEGVEMIAFYEYEGVRYGYFPKWEKHQRISHPTPSNLPSPSGELPEDIRPEREREQGKGKGMTTAAVAAAFDQFWEVYPNKTGKIAARKAFAKAIADGADPVALIAAAERYRDAPPPFPGYNPAHPTTWLNQGRWLDEGTKVPQRASEVDYEKELRRK